MTSDLRIVARPMPLKRGMSQHRTNCLLLIATLLVGTGACATMTPPAINSGPASSSNGVQVTVLRQLCGDDPGSDLYNRWVNETVEVQVKNGSPAAVDVHRDQFRLRAPSGRVFTSSGSPTDLLTIPNGETQTFEVRFTAHGELDCMKAMQLDPGPAITAQNSAVAMGPVSFVPLAVH